MPQIDPATDCQTVITTFETSPGTCQDLLDALQEAYAGFISKQPGFIAAGLHVGQDGGHGLLDGAIGFSRPMQAGLEVGLEAG